MSSQQLHVLGFISAGLSVFELIAWNYDSPLFIHEGPWQPRLALGLMNSVPHALFAYHAVHRRGEVSNMSLSLYAPYALTFVSQQLRLWWVPYFLGYSSSVDRTFLDLDKPGYQRAVKILPKLPYSVRVPAAEHTALILPSAAIAIGVTAALAQRCQSTSSRPTASELRWCAVLAVFTILPPALAVARGLVGRPQLDRSRAKHSGEHDIQDRSSSTGSRNGNKATLLKEVDVANGVALAVGLWALVVVTNALRTQSSEASG